MSQLLTNVSNNSINGTIVNLDGLDALEYRLDAEITHVASGTTTLVNDLKDAGGNSIRFTLNNTNYEEYSRINYTNVLVIEQISNTAMTELQAKNHADSLPACVVVVYNSNTGGMINFCEKGGTYIIEDQSITRKIFVKKFYPGPIYTDAFELHQGMSLSGGTTLYSLENVSLNYAIGLAELNPLCAGVVVITNPDDVNSYTYRTIHFKGFDNTLSVVEGAGYFTYLKKIAPLNVLLFDLYENTKLDVNAPLIENQIPNSGSEDVLGTALDQPSVHQCVFDKALNKWSTYAIGGTRVGSAGDMLYVKKQIQFANINIIETDVHGYTVQINIALPNDASQDYNLGFRITAFDENLQNGTVHETVSMVGTPTFNVRKNSLVHNIRVNRVDYPAIFSNLFTQIHQFSLRFYVGNTLILEPISRNTAVIPIPAVSDNLRIDFANLQLLDSDNDAVWGIMEVVKDDGSPAVLNEDYEVRADSIITQPSVYIRNKGGLPALLDGYNGDEITMIYTFSSTGTGDYSYEVSMSDTPGDNKSTLYMRNLNNALKASVKLTADTDATDVNIASDSVDPSFVQPYDSQVYQVGFTIHLMLSGEVVFRPYFNGETYAAFTLQKENNRKFDWDFARNLVINRFAGSTVNCVVQHYGLSIHRRIFNEAQMLDAYNNRPFFDDPTFIPYEPTDLLYRIDAQDATGYNITGTNIDYIYDLTNNITQTNVETNSRIGKLPIPKRSGQFTPMKLSLGMGNNPCFDGWMLQGSNWTLLNGASSTHITKTNTTGSYTVLHVCRITQQLPSRQYIIQLGSAFSGIGLFCSGSQGHMYLMYEGNFMVDTVFQGNYVDKDLLFIIKIFNNDSCVFQIHDIETNTLIHDTSQTFTFNKSFYDDFHTSVSFPYSMSLSISSITIGILHGESIVYNRNMSDRETSGYASYLSQKWSAKATATGSVAAFSLPSIVGEVITMDIDFINNIFWLGASKNSIIIAGWTDEEIDAFTINLYDKYVSDDTKVLMNWTLAQYTALQNQAPSIAKYDNFGYLVAGLLHDHTTGDSAKKDMIKGTFPVVADLLGFNDAPILPEVTQDIINSVQFSTATTNFTFNGLGDDQTIINNYAIWLYETYVSVDTQTALNWTLAEFTALQNTTPKSADTSLNYGYLRAALKRELDLLTITQFTENGITTGDEYHRLKHAYETQTRAAGWWGDAFLDWNFATDSASFVDTASSKTFTVASGVIGDIAFDTNGFTKANTNRFDLQYTNDANSGFYDIFNERRRKNIVFNIAFSIDAGSTDGTPLNVGFRPINATFTDPADYTVYGYRFTVRYNGGAPFFAFGVIGRRSETVNSQPFTTNYAVPMDYGRLYDLQITYYDNGNPADPHHNPIIVRDLITNDMLYSEIDNYVNPDVYDEVNGIGYDPAQGAWFGGENGGTENVSEGLRLTTFGLLRLNRVAFAEYNPAPVHPALFLNFPFDETATSVDGSMTFVKDDDATLDLYDNTNTPIIYDNSYAQFISWHYAIFNPSLAWPTTKMTVSWVSLSSSSINFPFVTGIFHEDLTAPRKASFGQNGFYIQLYNQNLMITVVGYDPSNPSINKKFHSNATVSGVRMDDYKKHCCITFDSTTSTDSLKFYIDGVLIQSFTMLDASMINTNLRWDTATQLRLNSRQTNELVANNDIYDYRIYNDVISQGEIDNIVSSLNTL